MKKILLVSLDSKYIHTNLAMLYLKSFTQDLSHSVEVEILELTINDNLDNMLQKILEKNADYIGFSTYIWNVDLIEKLENLISLVSSETVIFYGGPEVSYRCEEFLKNHKGKYLIEGEGERVFRNLLKYIIGDEELENIKGLYYKENDEIYYNGPSELIDINELVFPYEKYEFNTRIVYYESSRGCPFKCSYCLSSVSKGCRWLNVDRVKKEIDFFIEKKIKLVKFVDRTFNADIKFAKEIWKHIGQVQGETTFHFEIAGDILDEESIEILSVLKKNNIQLEIGVQTTNAKVTKNINRKTDLEKLRKNVQKLLKNQNINIHLDLIAGLPEEDLESFKNSFNEVYSMDSQELQLGFLKIIKGSPIEMDKEKYGIINSPYSPYEVLKTNHISYNELQELKQIESLVDKYLNSKRFNNSIKYLMEKVDRPYELYKNLRRFFIESGYFDRNISQLDYYRALLEFNSKYNRENNAMLEEIIKYDYLKYNKKKWIPEFLTRNLSIDKEKKIRNYLIENSLLKKNEKSHIELYKYDILAFEKYRNKSSYENIIIYGNSELDRQVFLEKSIADYLLK